MRLYHMYRKGLFLNINILLHRRNILIVLCLGMLRSVYEIDDYVKDRGKEKWPVLLI